MAMIQEQETEEMKLLPAEEKAEKTVMLARVRRKVGVVAFLNSPWLMLAVPLLVGGFWLVVNPWVITENLDKPYALLAGPALVGSLLAGWLIIKFFAVIERGLRLAWSAFVRARREDSSAQFFWMVTAVFLVVSVFASGDFFSMLEHNVFPGLGYATALFIDLLAVQAMRARLNAGRLRDRRGEALYLLGVVVCAAASAFANVYSSLRGFTPPAGAAAGVLPVWMIAVAPWVGVFFPLSIVLLSLTADHTIDRASTKLDPEQYKAHESKRVQLLEIQRDLLRQRVVFESEIAELVGTLRGRKDRRTFFLINWLFPKPGETRKQILGEVEKIYQPQLKTMTQQNESLQKQFAGFVEAAQMAYTRLDQSLAGFVQAMADEREKDKVLMADQVEGLHAEIRALGEVKAEVTSAHFQTGFCEVKSEVVEALKSGQNDEEPETEQVEVVDLALSAAAKSEPEEAHARRGEEREEPSIQELLRRPSVALEEAARILNCEVKYVRTLRDRGRIQRTRRTAERIMVASIKGYLAEKNQEVESISGE